MSTKLALAASALVAVLAGPALAHDHSVRHMTNAYAASTPAPVANPYQNDFQLQGRP